MTRDEFKRLLEVMEPKEPNLEQVREFISSLDECPPFLLNVASKVLHEDEVLRLAVHQFRAFALRQTPVSNNWYSQAVVKNESTLD